MFSIATAETATRTRTCLVPRMGCHSWALLMLSLWLSSSCAFAADKSLHAPQSAGEVRMRTLEWARQHNLPAEQLQQLQALWEGDASTSASASFQLETAVKAWSLGDPALAMFFTDCQAIPPGRYRELVSLTARPEPENWVSSNLRAYLGRCLAEQRMYDEALEQLLAVDLALAIDPAAVLFYRAVSAQEILEIPEAIHALNALLEQTEQVPPRYATIAELMRTELEGMQSQSLGEIARLMNDSERRLDLGRAGENVQGVQERIVSNLDELIKKLEAQQSGGGGGGGGSNNSNESSSGADDSRVKGTTAPGETDDKKFSKQGNWGDLPPKEQAAAKNLINREFPSHYRQAIETYFKKLAGRPAPANK